ncbi:MAG: DNA primase [Deltaproteobacteria bacterium]|nr:MAG: DNA primase [Deltaproteobacteria bacterium]
MSRINEETVREIRERSDIVEVISGYLPLKRSGGNYLGLCPFHQEKSPSFNVNAPRQIFHCFGCGTGGNVFTFIMRMEGLTFPEAVKRLGEKAGIAVEETPVTPADRQRRDQREKLLRINEAACTFYHRLLLEDAAGAAGRRYLRQRGFEGELVRTFRLGFAPDQWEALVTHLAGQGFSREELRTAGLVREGSGGRGDRDLFHNRLLFPILDPEGRVVAFGGRVLDDGTPKYLNSPETPVYQKGRTLYGLYQGRDAIRQARAVLVVEGYFDLLALHRAGIGNVVAACGTALTADHARLLKRYAEQTVLVFDADKAGRQATFRAMDALLPEGMAVSGVSLAAGEDPDSFLAKQGAAAFRTRLAEAKPALELFLDEQLALHGNSIEGVARAGEEVLARIRRLPSDLERNLYLKRLAARTGLDEALLQGKGRGGGPPRPAVASPAPVSAPQRPSAGPAERAQEFLLRLMLLEDDRYRRRVREEGAAGLFASLVQREVAEHLLALEDDAGRLPRELIAATLSPAAQGVLSGLLLAEGQAAWAEQPEKIFADCRRTVASGDQRQRLKELQKLIAAAEQAGDFAAVGSYLLELAEIKKNL